MAGQLCVADGGSMGAGAMRPTVVSGDGSRRSTSTTAGGSGELRMVVGGRTVRSAVAVVTVVVVAVAALVVAVSVQMLTFYSVLYA